MGQHRSRAENLFRGSVDGAQSVTATMHMGAILWPRGSWTEECVLVMRGPEAYALESAKHL